MHCFITEHWNKYLDEFQSIDIDIYYFEEYVRLYEDSEKCALCAVCLEDKNLLIFPFLRGEINGYFDFETAYGYGGPIANTKDKEWVAQAYESLNSMFTENNYLCGFVRYSSLLENALFANDAYIKIKFDRNTVWMDTSVCDEEIWKSQIKSKNRNTIRKAEKNGLVFEAEYDFRSMDEFIELYNLTMTRLEADPFYYFDSLYYDAFAKQLMNKAFLGTVRKDGELICAALFMYTEEYGHYHLEGSNPTGSSLGANNFLLWSVAKEFHAKGVKKFHLGGGFNSAADNSLLKFKRAFSDNIGDFYIGSWLFDNDAYNAVREEWKSKFPDKEKVYGGRLLCYRY